MKVIVEGTKQEIEDFKNTNDSYCRFPLICEDCRFYIGGICALTDMTAINFIKEYADFTIKDDKKSDYPITLTESQKEISEVVDGIKETLLTKNALYGNSILLPLRISSKKETTETDIPARLDDKLSRIKNSQNLRVNDIADLIGYSVLLLVQMGVKKQDLLDLID